MITISQGDSLGQDISCEDFTAADTFGVSWNGVWAIVPSIGAAPIVSGSLVKSADNKILMLRITPSQTNTLAAGRYFLVTRVNNSDTEFSEQIQKTELKVERKGI